MKLPEDNSASASVVGTLYLVATPIGNLEDVSQRALRVLEQADLIACEDTRHTAKLLTHYGIGTPRESYHEHNEARRTPEFIELLKTGRSIALVSDAGMPLISDPGQTLVSACRREGITVTPIPGPSAVLAALAGSGLPADRFLFAGFLSPKSAMRCKQLRELSSCTCTLVLYEAPHRLLPALEDMYAVLGTRQACLARELTKIHEEWLHGSLEQILEIVKSRPRIKGEIALVIAPGGGKAEPSQPDLSLQQDLENEIRKTGISHKEALRVVARRRGLSRRDAYSLLLRQANRDE
jgi:16S rRNA (cytidine1402-2'-O)-methyltransferase